MIQKREAIRLVKGRVRKLDGRAEDHLAAIRDAVQSVDPQVPVLGERPQVPIWIFAGCALLPAVIEI